MFFDWKQFPDLKTQFDDLGFAVLKGFHSTQAMDAVTADIQAYLATPSSRTVVVDCLESGRRTFKAAVPPDERVKVNDLFLLLDSVSRICNGGDLPLILSILMGQPAVLCNGLYFERGSSQPMHVDSLYMTPQTEGDLIATWIALENVEPTAGPLFYYPGSHKIPSYRFSNGSRHVIFAEMAGWNTFIKSEVRSRGLRPVRFMAEKGDVLIWNEKLLHGGGRIADRNITRHSYVSHYYSVRDCLKEGCRLADNAHGGRFMDKVQQGVVGDFSLAQLAEWGYDWKRYLERHPDVARDVTRGTCPSAEYHYDVFGRREKRML